MAAGAFSRIRSLTFGIVVCGNDPGSGVAIGAYAGMVAAAGTPSIIVTVPAGMIIGGAAAGIAKALQEGLYDRLLSWIRGKSRQPA